LFLSLLLALFFELQFSDCDTVFYVWVYTSAFAKRFGMPQEWVDDELKGAEALAYRLDLDVYGTKCGYFHYEIIA
jgi:hypothetical protein